jgi:sorbitol-specific phosphotransferase system component IIBC
MPLQMRLPKFGFSSRVGRITAEVRTSELNKVDGGLITIGSLRKARVITANIKRVKVMLSGEVAKKFTVEGVGVSKGAKEAIEKAGGKVIEVKATEPTKKTEPEAKAKKAAKKVKVAEAKDAAPAGESPADKASDGEGKADKE